jgi:hypothetical protein
MHTSPPKALAGRLCLKMTEAPDGQLCDHAKVMKCRGAMDEWAPDHTCNAVADDHSAGTPGTKAWATRNRAERIGRESDKT